MNNMPNNYSPMGGGGFCMDMPGGPGAPEIKGTWISKKTGAEVQVRDCIIAENGMSVMLSDGRMIDMNEFSTEFYQISDDIYDSNGNIISETKNESDLYDKKTFYTYKNGILVEYKSIRTPISFEEKVKYQLLYDQIKKENAETTRRVIYS